MQNPYPNAPTLTQRKYYAQLHGYRVVGLTFDPVSGFGEPLLGLVLRHETQPDLIAWIMADEEGNGPGALHIMEPKPAPEGGEGEEDE